MSRRKKNKARKQPPQCERLAVEVSIDMSDTELVESFGEELGSTVLGLGVSLEGIMDAVTFADRHVTNKGLMIEDLIAAGDVIHAYVRRLTALTEALSDAQKMKGDSSGKTVSRYAA